MRVVDALKILGLDKIPTNEELKKAYRSELKKNHSDINPTLTSDENTRKIYDAKECLENYRNSNSTLTKVYNEDDREYKKWQRAVSDHKAFLDTKLQLDELRNTLFTNSELGILSIKIFMNFTDRSDRTKEELYTEYNELVKSSITKIYIEKLRKIKENITAEEINNFLYRVFNDIDSNTIYFLNQVEIDLLNIDITHEAIINNFRIMPIPEEVSEIDELYYKVFNAIVDNYSKSYVNYLITRIPLNDNALSDKINILIESLNHIFGAYQHLIKVLVDMINNSSNPLLAKKIIFDDFINTLVKSKLSIDVLNASPNLSLEHFSSLLKNNTKLEEEEREIKLYSEYVLLESLNKLDIGENFFNGLLLNNTKKVARDKIILLYKRNLDPKEINLGVKNIIKVTKLLNYSIMYLLKEMQNNINDNHNRKDMLYQLIEYFNKNQIDDNNIDDFANYIKEQVSSQRKK